MATFYTDLTSADPQNEAHNRPSGGDVTGSLLVATATYTLAGTETASDFINLVELPVSSIVIPEQCTVAHQDVGTELVFDIGDDDDPNRYALAVTCGTNEGLRAFVATGDATLPAQILTPYTIIQNETDAGNRMIKADITTATSLTASQKLVFRIVYHLG